MKGFIRKPGLKLCLLNTFFFCLFVCFFVLLLPLSSLGGLRCLLTICRQITQPTNPKVSVLLSEMGR